MTVAIEHGEILRAQRERRIGELSEQKAALVAYLRSKLNAEDWHAVQDAASDIRELAPVHNKPDRKPRQKFTPPAWAGKRR